MTDEWIPEVVRVLAAMIETGKPIGEKLLALEPVWNQLARPAEDLDISRELSKRLAALPRSWKLDWWEIDTFEVSLPDQALAAFYCAVVVELGLNKRALTKSNVEEFTRPYRDAASLIRTLLSDPAERPHTSKNLAMSLANSADFLDEKVDTIEQANAASAYCLPRSSGQRNDSSFRAKSRALAQIIETIFGQCMYETVAVLAAALLGGKKVSKTTMQSWCEGVRISNDA